MKVLVTGASGFLGFHLLCLLQQNGVEIHTIDLKPSHIGLQHNVSLADANGLKKILTALEPDYIVHLAGVAVASDIRTYYAINTGFATNLIWALKEWGNLNCPVVLTGTSAEYGLIANEQLPITENTSAKPYDHYGISKLAQTLMGIRESRDGLPLIMIRPFNIIGPGMPEHLALQSFVQQVIKIMQKKSESIIETGDLSPTRDFVDVRDVADLIWQLLRNPSAYGEVINICTGIGTSIGDLLYKLMDAANINSEVRTVLHKIKHVDVPVHFGSNEKLLKLTGFIPRRNLNTTLMDVLNYNLSKYNK
jgi:nucleoside-diphosphate-sugar epimerase